MISSHNAAAWIDRLNSTLPAEVTDATWDQPMPKSALVGTIRTRLLPSIVGGPAYRRNVDDALQRAIRAFRQGDGASFLLWLGDASKAAA